VVEGQLAYCVFKHDKEQHKVLQERLASWVSSALA
jgi:hypothetical protein